MAQPKSGKGRQPKEEARKEHHGEIPNGGKGKKKGYVRADRRQQKSWLRRFFGF